MSDFPEKAKDGTNAAAVMVIGLATTAVLWAFVVYLQAYFATTEGDIAAERAAMGKSAEVRDLKAAQRADLSKTKYADPSKGTLKRLDIRLAKSLVVRDAKAHAPLIPTLGELNVPTVPASAGRPVDGAAIEAPAAPEAPAAAEPGCDEASCLATPDKPCCQAAAAAAAAGKPPGPAPEPSAAPAVPTTP